MEEDPAVVVPGTAPVAGVAKKAMPSLVVKSAHLPDAVSESMLVKQGEIVADKAAHACLAVLEPVEAEAQAARLLVHQRLHAARNAVGVVPLPPMLPPLVGAPPALPELPEVGQAPSLGALLAHPGSVVPWADVTRVSLMQIREAVASREAAQRLQGPQDTGRLNVDPEDAVVTLRAAVASPGASTACGCPAVTVGPPQWMDIAVARFCETEYLHPNEDIIAMEKKILWVTAVDGWRTAPDRG